MKIYHNRRIKKTDYIGKLNKRTIQITTILVQMSPIFTESEFANGAHILMNGSREEIKFESYTIQVKGKYYGYFKCGRELCSHYPVLNWNFLKEILPGIYNDVT